MLKPFFVWSNKVLKRVNPADVVCLKIVRNYTLIFLSDESYFMVRSTLSGALRKLPPEMFVRVHRSYAVSIYFIDTLERDLLTIGNETIPIGPRYYKQMIKQLNVIE